MNHYSTRVEITRVTLAISLLGLKALRGVKPPFYVVSDRVFHFSQREDQELAKLRNLSGFSLDRLDGLVVCVSEKSSPGVDLSLQIVDVAGFELTPFYASERRFKAGQLGLPASRRELVERRPDQDSWTDNGRYIHLSIPKIAPVNPRLALYSLEGYRSSDYSRALFQPPQPPSTTMARSW